MVETWPSCTVTACKCKRYHRTDGDMWAAVTVDNARTQPWCDDEGNAVCACHPPVAADALRLTPFPCNVPLRVVA